MVDDIKKAMIRKFAKKTKKSLPFKRPPGMPPSSGTALDMILAQRTQAISSGKTIANTSVDPKQHQAVFDKTRAKGKAVSEAEKHDSAVKRQTDKKTTRKKLVVADKHTAKTIASNKRLATEDKMRARSKTAKTRGEAFKAVGAATRDSQAKFDKALINARKSFYKAQQALGALQAGFDEDKKKRKVRNIERAIQFRRRQGARSGFKPAALTTGELLERSPTNANSQLSRKAAGVQMFKKQFKRGVAGGNRMFRHMRKMF